MDEKKVISIEDRIPKLKEARKKKANRMLMYYLSILFVLILIVIYLQSPLSNVKTVHIEGNKYISDEEMLKLTEINDKTNIWEVSSGKLADKIRVEPLIKEVSVSRKLPQTVEVVVEEYPIVGFMESENNHLILLPNGETITMENNQIDLADAPLLKGFDDAKLREQMAKELSITDEEIFHLISEVILQESESTQTKILLYMNDGFMVDTTVRQFAQKMQDYPSIVAQIDEGETGIIHMGVGTYFERIK